MVLTNKQVQQRITKLIKEDDKSNNIIHGYYEEALNNIKRHLMVFYIKYARKTGLTIAQVEQRVTSWDIQQFKQAIDLVNQEVDSDDTDSETKRAAKKRIKKAKATATISRRDLIMSLITLAVVYASVKADKHAKTRVKIDIKDELNFRNVSKQMAGISVDYLTNLSQSIWNTADELNGIIDYLVNKELAGEGITPLDLEKLFPYMNSNYIKPKSITAYVNQAYNNAIRVVRTESARMVDEITMADFRKRNVAMVDWVTEPGACQKCEAIAEDGPYYIDDCPSIPGSSHPNCRCSKVEYRETS